MRRCLTRIVLLATCLCETTLRADEAQIKADEATVRQANVKPDGPALIDLFHTLTPGEKALEAIATHVRDLGHRSYRARERAAEKLIRIGYAAIAPLKEASASKDLEVARRANECLRLIEHRGQPDLITAAARLLAVRKPAGAAQALLDYLPFAESEYILEEIVNALPHVVFVEGKADPAARKALEDRNPLRRGAAAEAFVRGGSDADRESVRTFLKDANPKVRSRVALAFVEKKERAAVEVLIDLLPQVGQEQVWAIEQTLVTLAGENAPKTSPGKTPNERQVYRDAWGKWWKDQGEKVNFAVLENAHRSQGLTLIVALDTRRAGVGGVVVGGRILYPGRVYEMGRDGKPRWEIDKLNYPVDAQIVGPDRVLIAEYRSREVTERTFAGEIVWRKTIDTYATSAQRLPNGNTLISTMNSVIEVTRAGEEVLRLPTPNSSVCGAKRMRNGDTVVLDRTGMFVRYDAKGKELKRVALNNLVSTIGTQFDVTSAGNLVLPLYSHNKVAEYDPNGKQVWSVDCERPTSATRLVNGNTLIASRYNPTVIEVDRNGKKVWEHSTASGNIMTAKRR